MKPGLKQYTYNRKEIKNPLSPTDHTFQLKDRDDFGPQARFPIPEPKKYSDEHLMEHVKVAEGRRTKLAFDYTHVYANKRKCDTNYVKRPETTLRTDVEGAKPKTLHPTKSGKEFNTLTVKGIDGCVPKKKLFKPREIKTERNKAGAAGLRPEALRALKKTEKYDADDKPK